MPSWNAPFFLTSSYKYAEKYSDYGVYKVTLKDAIKSSICDFDNDSDVRQLNWPKLLIDQIRSGKSDLNGIALDLWIMVNGTPD